jgi:hypothetical protein
MSSLPARLAPLGSPVQGVPRSLSRRRCGVSMGMPGSQRTLSTAVMVAIFVAAGCEVHSKSAPAARLVPRRRPRGVGATLDSAPFDADSLARSCAARAHDAVQRVIAASIGRPIRVYRASRRGCGGRGTDPVLDSHTRPRSTQPEVRGRPRRDRRHRGVPSRAAGSGARSPNSDVLDLTAPQFAPDESKPTSTAPCAASRRSRLARLRRLHPEYCRPRPIPHAPGSAQLTVPIPYGSPTIGLGSSWAPDLAARSAGSARERSRRPPLSYRVSLVWSCTQERVAPGAI